jgi:hypothetical protein
MANPYMALITQMITSSYRSIYMVVFHTSILDYLLQKKLKPANGLLSPLMLSGNRIVNNFVRQNWLW